MSMTRIGGAAPIDTVRVMGLDVAAVSERDTIDYVLRGLQEGRGGWICTANLDILRQWRRSEDLRTIVAGADLVVADGMPLLWAGELQGSPLPERVAGSSLIVSLATAAADAGATIFLLGGNPGTAEAAAQALVARNPGTRLAGTLCPRHGFEDAPNEVHAIVEYVCASSPDIVYVALGFPKQERLIEALRPHLPRTWFIPCGISFSFVAGEIGRAPVVVQRLGLEWLHRLVQEPRRLWRRYVLDGIPFLVRLLWSSLSARRTADAPASL